MTRSNWIFCATVLVITAILLDNYLLEGNRMARFLYGASVGVSAVAMIGIKIDRK